MNASTDSLAGRSWKVWLGDLLDLSIPLRTLRPGHYSRSGILWVALISGLCGAYLGTRPTLQTAVESAQVLAGKVEYPADNPFYMYHIKTWTLLHQAPAVLLALGCSERAVCLLLGALIGMIAFQAVALCTLAVSRNCLLAIMAPMLFLASHIYMGLGNVYFVHLITRRPTQCYGTLGTAVVVLAWALYALGLRRQGAFLMGLAPAVHPTLGCWCLAFGVFGVFMNRRNESARWRTVLGWLSAGVLVAAVSFAVHLWHARHVPPISPELRVQFVEAFVEGWDTHRQPVYMWAVFCVMGSCTLALCALWLGPLAADLDEGLRFLLWTLGASAGAGLLLSASTHIQQHLPTFFVMAMPARYINVTCLAFPPLVVGLLGRRRHDALLLTVLAGILVCMAIRASHFIEPILYFPRAWFLLLFATLMVLAAAWRLAPSPTAWLRRLGAVAAVALVLLSVWMYFIQWRLGLIYLCGGLAELCPRFSSRWLGRPACRLAMHVIIALCGLASCLMTVRWGLSIALSVGLLAAWVATMPRWWPAAGSWSAPARWSLAGGMAALACVVLCASSNHRIREGLYFMEEWHDNPLLHRVHQGRGALLTGSSIRTIQLKTGRPVVMDGAAMNQLPYVPESALSMNHILKHVYGDDILAPRPAWWKRERGGLMDDSGKELWQRRSVAEWQDLARDFGFTEVMSFSHWKLKLPEIARYRHLVLYAVPAAGAPPDRVAEQTPAAISSK